MAMRSSGGTGVLVALIIFIFMTVGCAAAAILLYGQKNKAVEDAQRAGQDLEEVMKPSEQGRTDIKTLSAEAANNRKSLVGHMLDRSQGYRTFVTGNPNADEGATRSRFNIPENMTLADAFTRTIQDKDMFSNRVNELEARVADLQSQLGRQQSDYSQLQSDSDDRVAEVTNSIGEYRTAAEQYRSDITATQNEYRRSMDQNNEQHRNEVAMLQEEIDDLNGNQTVLSSRLNELRKVVDAIRIKPQNPAELVDGRVIDVLGSSGQIFIDLGRQDRIRPGMTFEVYDDPGQIRIDPNSGEYSRGKASIQVIKVADTTATARVTRNSGSRPVVRDDVVANAVFNPQYRFKFLVFGKFDVDDNGSPTETEADYIRSRIIEWGGEVVEGNQLTGDLDFVVLGEVPDYVPTELIPQNATPAEIDAILKKREAYDHYEALFQQAINAQIPVLNWNRFRILTGESDS